MQILASRFIYPKEQRDLVNILSSFKGMSIQLSFFMYQDFFKMGHKFIKETCDSLNINIPTVHAPTVDVFNSDFLKVMEEIKKVYETGLITIHPQRGDTGLALAKLEEFASVFKDLEIILAYENFPSQVCKRKWICLPKDMYLRFNLPFLKLTFDTSHLDSPKDSIEEFKQVADKVAIIHLSDAIEDRQHQPLGSGCVLYKQFLDYLKLIAFSGPVVIEYLPEFETQLIEDVKRIQVEFPYFSFLNADGRRCNADGRR